MNTFTRICDDCGYVFENPVIVILPPGEEWESCPACKSTEINEAAQCLGCGETKNYYNLENEYCEDCGIGIIKRFHDFLENGFSTKEREYLNEFYDGKAIA